MTETFVFWGVNGRGGRKNFETAVVEVGVYDPDEDLWDIVAPVPWRDAVRYSTVDKFATVGETFVIHSFFHSTDPWRSISLVHTYHTDKDEWKIDEHFSKRKTKPTDAFMTMNQKLYTIDPKNSTLKIYNEASSSWSSACVSILRKLLDPVLNLERMQLKVRAQELIGSSSASPRIQERYGDLPYNLCSGALRFKDVQEVLAITVVRSDLKDVAILCLTKTIDTIIQIQNYPMRVTRSLYRKVVWA